MENKAEKTINLSDNEELMDKFTERLGGRRDLAEQLVKSANRSLEELNEHLEMMAAAYFQKTGIDPEKVVLVQEPNGMGGFFHYFIHVNVMEDMKSTARAKKEILDNSPIKKITK